MRRDRRIARRAARAQPLHRAAHRLGRLRAACSSSRRSLFRSDFGVSMLAQMGIAIVACLSYNMLLGQGGMLSFGHAVYTGLGTFVAVHAMIAIGERHAADPGQPDPARRRPRRACSSPSSSAT